MLRVRLLTLQIDNRCRPLTRSRLSTSLQSQGILYNPEVSFTSQWTPKGWLDPIMVSVDVWDVRDRIVREALQRLQRGETLLLRAQDSSSPDSEEEDNVLFDFCQIHFYFTIRDVAGRAGVTKCHSGRPM
jgi:hypothetical protein